MAYDLSSIKNTKRDRPPIVTIYGDHKIGKTTFAAEAPNPIFIQTEDGAANVDAQAFPLCKSTSDVLECIETLRTQEHDFRTVVLDSVDHLELLIGKDVAEANEVEHFGLVPYGRGANEVRSKFYTVATQVCDLRESKNMAVIILGHAENKRINDPLRDAFDRKQIKLLEQNASVLRELSDAIGLATLDTVLKEEEQGFGKIRKRAAEKAPRVLLLGKSDAYDAGNRFGLPDRIQFNYQAFADAFKQARGEN